MSALGVSRGFWVAVVLTVLFGCGGGGGGGSGSSAPPPAPTVNRSVQVSWVANRETAVNSPGGGYRVYYSRTPGFNVSAASVADVPYTSGATAPTSTVLTLQTGSNFIKVVAYSVMNPGGSAPSVEASIVVP